jgi:septal ring factor EnvC (AmiA/AmiB activator)
MAKSFLFFFLLFITTGISAQENKADLEKQRQANQREMEMLKKELDKASGAKKKSLKQLTAIQTKLRLRQQQITIINRQMNFIEGDINNSWREIEKLKKELDTLKYQYEKSVSYAYKNRSNYDFLNFLFSATTFNDAVKRVSYLKSYRAYREEQATNIIRTQTLLQEKITGLKENQARKTATLKEENQEKNELELEKRQKDAIVAELKTRESEIKSEIAKKKKSDLALAKALRVVIERERKKAIDEARKREKEREALAKAEAAKKNAATIATPEATVTTVKTKPEKTTESAGRTVSLVDVDPEAKAMSDNFEKNKGSLPWPVSGSVKMGFGPHKYEDLNVVMDNPGITMETSVGESVKAVFDGEVSTITNIGSVQAIIIRHGKYFTTYSNLESVSVTRGQQVKRGQVIGKVSELDGRGSLEFIISNDASKNLDPEKWLR